jgi:glycosyltransferase involved in cell wall biosynthesis
MPVFSVIITTYKRPVLLQRALRSVVEQTFNDFECIVINDEPNDNAAVQNIVNSLNDDRFSLIPAMGNHGGNYCRNIGLVQSKGTYVAFLDDDDIWFTDKLQEHLKVHQATDADLVFSTYVSKWDNEDRSELFVPGVSEPENIIRSILNGDFSIGTTSSVTLKKSSVPGVLFDESLVSFQDWDAWLSIALKKPGALFKKIERPLLYFFHHEADRTSRDWKKRRKGLEQVFSKYQEFQDIRGFYNNELLNIYILKANATLTNPISKRAFLLYRFFLYPPFWLNLFAIKRVGKYILTGE